jgi:anaerobic selenocysteine-containing dehydrogenase
VRTTPTTEFSDRTWIIRPGSDLSLALFLCGRAIRRNGLPGGAQNGKDFSAIAFSIGRDRVLKETGLNGKALEELENFVLDTRPLSIWMGWGPQRARTGASLASVLDSLGILTGNRGIPGGGVAFNQEIEGLLPEGVFDVPGAHPRIVSRNGLGRALLEADPPVEAALFVRGNPVSQCGDAGSIRRFLENCPFSVCLDYRMSLTARSCSLVLPVSLPLERGGDFVSSYWHDIVQETSAITDPPFGIRHELDILAEIAAGLGLPDRFHPAFEAVGRHIRSLDWLEPLASGMWRARPRIPEESPFRFPVCLDAPARADASLRLVTVHSRGYTNGQDLRQALPPETLPEAAFSPADAERLDLRDGQPVALVNRRGRLPVRVRLDPGMAPGTVVAEQAAEGLNDLVSPETTPRGHSCINETWVDVQI